MTKWNMGFLQIANNHNIPKSYFLSSQQRSVSDPLLSPTPVESTLNLVPWAGVPYPPTPKPVFLEVRVPQSSSMTDGPIVAIPPRPSSSSSRAFIFGGPNLVAEGMVVVRRW